MDLWDKVCKTDPSHTKKVSQRGGFTAIDAHYQIQEATRAFGPIGQGWGYDVEGYEVVNGIIIVKVTLWHGERSNKFGPILGCSEMFGKRADSDAPKKATTDAITKGLSQLGFNADVFLGKFDDNKYVAELKANQPRELTGIDKQWIAAIKEDEGAINQIQDPAYKAYIQELLK
jgi:hypothetical protein